MKLSKYCAKVELSKKLNMFSVGITSVSPNGVVTSVVPSENVGLPEMILPSESLKTNLFESVSLLGSSIRTMYPGESKYVMSFERILNVIFSPDCSMLTLLFGCLYR